MNIYVKIYKIKYIIIFNPEIIYSKMSVIKIIGKRIGNKIYTQL